MSETYLTPVQENKLVASMTNPRNRWEITERHKQAAIGVTVKNMSHNDGRISNAAVSNMLRMEAQNQADELAANGPHGPTELHLHSHQHVEARETVSTVLENDHDYIDYLRQRALEADSVAGPVRAVGEPGPVEDGQAPGVPGLEDYAIDLEG